MNVSISNSAKSLWSTGLSQRRECNVKFWLPYSMKRAERILSELILRVTYICNVVGLVDFSILYIRSHADLRRMYAVP
jgi:hypothetical protein